MAYIYNKRIQNRWFPFSYTFLNPGYLPKKLTTEESGDPDYIITERTFVGELSRTMSASKVPYYYYYQFIDEKLDSIDKMFDFLVTILSTGNYNESEDTTPIMFRAYSDYIPNGHNYVKDFIPADMTINPKAVIEDFIAQFPTLAQGEKGNQLKELASKRNLAYLFEEKYVKELTLSKNAKQLRKEIAKRNPSNIINRIVTILYKNEIYSYSVVADALKTNPDYLVQLIDELGVDDLINLFSSSTESDELIAVFLTDVPALINKLGDKTASLPDGIKKLILESVSASDFFANNASKIKAGSLTAYRSLAQKISMPIVNVWLSSMPFSEDWVAFGLELKKLAPELLSKLNIIEPQKQLFFTHVLPMPEITKSAKVIFTELKHQPLLIEEYQGLLEEIGEIRKNLTVSCDTLDSLLDSMPASLPQNRLIREQEIQELDRKVSKLTSLVNNEVKYTHLLEKILSVQEKLTNQNLLNPLLNYVRAKHVTEMDISRFKQSEYTEALDKEYSELLHACGSSFNPVSHILLSEGMTLIANWFSCTSNETTAAIIIRLSELELVKQRYRTWVSMLDDLKVRTGAIYPDDVTKNFLLKKDVAQLKASLTELKLKNFFNKTQAFINIFTLVPTDENQKVLNVLKDKATDSLFRKAQWNLNDLYKLALRIDKEYRLSTEEGLTTEQASLFLTIKNNFANKNFTTIEEISTFLDNNLLSNLQSSVLQRVRLAETINANNDPAKPTRWQAAMHKIANEATSNFDEYFINIERQFTFLNEIINLHAAVTKFIGTSAALQKWQEKIDLIFPSTLSPLDKFVITNNTRDFLDDFLSGQLASYHRLKPSFFFPKGSAREQTMSELHQEIKALVNNPTTEHSLAYRLVVLLMKAEQQTIADHEKGFWGAIGVTKSRLANTLHQAIEDMHSAGQINDLELQEITEANLAI